MTDEEKSLYEEYNTSLTAQQELLKSYLGVTLDVDFDRYILYPYYNTILTYINGKLAASIGQGEDDLKTLVQIVFDEFKSGGDLICGINTTSLADTLKLRTGNLNYYDERLAFSWAHVMTSLCTLLRLMYGYLFDSTDDCDCCCCCSDKKGCCKNTTSEYESWVSNVYADDEENNTANYERTNSPWQSSITKFNDYYRKNTGDDDNTCPCCSE